MGHGFGHGSKTDFYRIQLIDRLSIPAWKQLRIGVTGDRNRGMAQVLLDVFQVLAIRDESACIGMSDTMHIQSSRSRFRHHGNHSLYRNQFSAI